MSPVTLITEAPRSVSPAEHRQLVASTPASFSDIPPVLRHKEEGVTVTLDPPVEGFSTADGAKGTLYIIESVLAFISETGKGFQLDYPTITLHAIARGDTGPSIYCQLDEAPQTQDVQANDSEEGPDMRELRIVPTEHSSLEPIFEALSFCAALHPDPQDMEDDMDDAFIDADESAFETFTGDEEQELSEVGRASLAYLESIIEDPHRRLPQSEDEEGKEEPSTQVNGH